MNGRLDNVNNGQEYPLNQKTTDWSISAIVSGFLAVLISYAGPLVIFFQAASMGNIANDMMVSWVWGISIGAGISGIFLSWWLKVPVVTAWSAPGTVLLISLFPEITMSQVVGAYLSSAFLLFIIGITGYFDKAVRLIPQGIAAGMIAGILLQFGLRAFEASALSPLLSLGMILAYILSRRYLPRYNIVIVAIVGFSIAFLLDKTNLSMLSPKLAMPMLTAPDFDFATFLSFTIPLTLVSLTGQFLPGMTILNLAGYRVPAKAIIVITALASMLVAFTGGITIVLAAITAAICTGKDAHENKEKRYIAGISNGIFYLVGGLFAGTIVMLFTALPKELITILAGLALIGAITANLAIVIEDTRHREASLITFLATASGMTMWGLGSAFWGIVIGLLAFFIMSRNTPLPEKKSS